MTMRLRLVKVTMQATCVIDDGESLREQVTEPVTIAAADWPDYAASGFAEQLAQAELSLNEPAPDQP